LVNILNEVEICILTKIMFDGCDNYHRSQDVGERQTDWMFLQQGPIINECNTYASAKKLESRNNGYYLIIIPQAKTRDSPGS
jgi:hypothetical protein